MNNLQNLSPDLVEFLLKEVKFRLRRQKTKTAKQRTKIKLPKDENFRSVRVGPTVISNVKKEDVIKHFTEKIIPNIDKEPSYAIKAQIVSFCELVASLEKDRAKRDSWRRKAVKVVMIDTREHLLSYVATMATKV